jgi:hypothetical protein
VSGRVQHPVPLQLLDGQVPLRVDRAVSQDAVLGWGETGEQGDHGRGGGRRGGGADLPDSLAVTAQSRGEREVLVEQSAPHPVEHHENVRTG